MTTRIVLLRAVNVGPAQLPMADLRAIATDLGATDVRTYIASGNLVADVPGDPAAFDRALEQAVEQRFGFFRDVISRTPEQVRAALDASLPPGIDVLECVEAVEGSGSLADRLDATRWRIDLPGVDAGELAAAVQTLLARDEVLVTKRTKNGTRDMDARAAVVRAAVAVEAGCAILQVVVRQLTPTVRPEDVMAALAAVADLRPPLPPRAVREAQGRLDDTGDVADPLGPDREAGSRCQGEPQPV
jgi:hypothetical protein